MSEKTVNPKFIAILLLCKVRYEAHPDYGKGVKRDKATMDFLLGAASMATIQGDDRLYAHIVRVVGMIISVRGYQEVLQILENTPQEAVDAARKLVELPNPNE